MTPTPRPASLLRSFHSSALRHNDDDDNPWGDLDKAFENLQDKSLYQQVPKIAPQQPLSQQGVPPPKDRRDVSDMEEMIFAQAGAASVRNNAPPQPAVTRGLTFSDVPPSAGPQRWSEYMQDGKTVDDSPWASLDAFADNPDSSAQFAVPFAPQQPQHDPVSRKSALSAEEEAMFARAGAASVSSDASDALTHVDAATGKARMVDVGMKSATARSATATGRVYMPTAAAGLIRQTEGSASGVSGKGPVLHTAQLAGIMGAKRTADLIPLCHTLALSSVDVSLTITDESESESCVHVACTAKTVSQTGVEMEALTGCMTACLTVWDMTKAIAGQTMRISDVKVVAKSGGKSGDWVRQD